MSSSLFPAYIRDFAEHASSVRSHFSGADDGFESSISSNGTLWSATEKSQFFRSLIRHSRLRLDIIAEEIRTKSVADVCAYLELLDDAASAYDTTPVLGFAHEMSPVWIRLEEHQGGLISTMDDHYDLPPPRKKRKKTDVKEEIAEELGNQEEKGPVQLEYLTAARLTVLEGLIRRAEEVGTLGIDDAMGEYKKVDGPRDEDEDGDDARSSSSSAAPIQDDTPEPDLSSLDPKERERLRKRLYMRRKRAKKSGGEVDERIVRLKPGRKQGASTPVAKRKRKPKVRGKTLPLKIKAEFEAAGIDIDEVRNDGMDLFKLSGLGRLMRSYSIDDLKLQYPTIELLRGYLVHFLSRCIHHCVVSADQDYRAKAHTKVWRSANTRIRLEHFRAAMEAMGDESYEATRTQCDVSQKDKNQGGDNDSDSTNACESESESELQSEDAFHLPRRWFPNFVFHSSLFPHGGKGMTQDLLMDSGNEDYDNDGDTAEAELDEEQAAADIRADRDYEGQLWAQFDPADLAEGGTGTRPEGKDERMDGDGDEGKGEELSYPEVDKAASGRGRGWQMERELAPTVKFKSKETISDSEDEAET